jgi:hypothetical protein
MSHKPGHHKDVEKKDPTSPSTGTSSGGTTLITPGARGEGSDRQRTEMPTDEQGVRELLNSTQLQAFDKVLDALGINNSSGNTVNDITREYWPDTYWDGSSPGMTGPSLGDYDGDFKSSRQDVWDGYGYYSLNKDQQKLVRDATDAHYNRKVDDASFYGNILKTALARSSNSASSGNPITVEQALREIVDNGGIDGRNRGGSGSGSKGPTPADPTSIRRVMDVTSSALIGRTISEDEFNKFYKQYTNEFGSNPDVDPNQLAKEYARTDEDYQEYQVASKFSKSMSRVLRGIL